MEKNKEENKREEESQAWNISKDYVHDLIMARLTDIEKHRSLAIFGYSTLEHDLFVNNPNLRTRSRRGALSRMIDSMKSLIYFSTFSLKNPDHLKKFEVFLSRLRTIESKSNNLFHIKYRGNKITELKIHENLMEKVMSELSEMTNKIVCLLNESGIIFARHEVKDFKKSVTDF